MLKFVNHKTGKLIITENKDEIPKVGLCVTGWSQISTEIYNELIDCNYKFPAWDYPAVSLSEKVRNNPENKTLIIF